LPFGATPWCAEEARILWGTLLAEVL
jgi:hypothetical protein